MKMRRIKLVGCVLAILCAIVLIIVSSVYITTEALRFGAIYEENDLRNYGQYLGNYDNKTPTEFIESFFPSSIEENFSEVVYHYKALCGDTYAYEAFLEFTISDALEFEKFLNNMIDTSQCIPFEYDSSYMEYTISNCLSLNITDISKRAKQGPYYIDFAEIGKVLYSEEKQQFVFVAIGVYDGGMADTSLLGYFFSKFDINPLKFERQAFGTRHEQEAYWRSRKTTQ